MRVSMKYLPDVSMLPTTGAETYNSWRQVSSKWMFNRRWDRYMLSWTFRDYVRSRTRRLSELAELAHKATLSGGPRSCATVVAVNRHGQVRLMNSEAGQVYHVVRFRRHELMLEEVGGNNLLRSVRRKLARQRSKQRDGAPSGYVVTPNEVRAYMSSLPLELELRM